MCRPMIVTQCLNQHSERNLLHSTGAAHLYPDIIRVFNTYLASKAKAWALFNCPNFVCLIHCCWGFFDTCSTPQLCAVKPYYSSWNLHLIIHSRLQNCKLNSGKTTINLPRMNLIIFLTSACPSSWFKHKLWFPLSTAYCKTLAICCNISYGVLSSKSVYEFLQYCRTFQKNCLKLIFAGRKSVKAHPLMK